jgi:hypothetical protein
MSGMDIHKAREIYLADGYGRFDGIEQLLDRSEILTARPRMLRKAVASMLGLQTAEVNNKTFMSWLYRARKRLSQTSAPVFLPTASRREPATTDQRGKETSGDWREFRASEPKRTEEDDLAAVRFPDYGDPS